MTSGVQGRLRRLKAQAVPGRRIVVVSLIADAGQIVAQPGEALLVIATGVPRSKELGKW